MKLVIHRHEEKIRLVIVCFSAFMALMLFQTSYMQLGTLTASITLFATIGAYFLQGKGLRGRIAINGSAACLMLFLVYSVLMTLVKGTNPGGLVRYVGQIVMCLLLCSVNLNGREHNYLKGVFVCAAAVYSVLIIQSYFVNVAEGYYHQNVELFNTELDPNFVGMPLVAATVLLLDNVLNRRKWFRSIALYALVVTAIIYTASRGSFVALICSNLLLVAGFVLRRNLRPERKLMVLLASVLLLCLLVPVFAVLFPKEWERITLYESYAGDSRWHLWQNVLELWWENPVFGKGLGYVFATLKCAAHNTYVKVLCETGLVGFCLMCGFVLPMIKKAFRKDYALFCVMIGMFLQIMFLDALDNRCVWVLVSWVVMLPPKSTY